MVPSRVLGFADIQTRIIAACALKSGNAREVDVHRSNDQGMKLPAQHPAATNLNITGPGRGSGYLTFITLHSSEGFSEEHGIRCARLQALLSCHGALRMQAPTSMA